MSSSPDPYQSYFDSYEPKQELDSPFVNEEYLVDEAKIAQWKVPAPVVQLESPFLQAFEEGWGASEVGEFEDFFDKSDEEEFEEKEFSEFLGELDEEEFEGEEAIADYSNYELEQLETEKFSEFHYELDEDEFYLDEDELFSEDLINSFSSEELKEEWDLKEEEYIDKLEEWFAEEIETSSPLRQEIVRVAKQEWERWEQGNKVETDSDMRDVLRDYWMNLGLSQSKADQKIADQDPWSAAFISYVMRKAGAGKAFAYKGLHTHYIAEAKKASISQDNSKFWAYEISAVKPEIGDLVCRDRQRKKGAPCAETNFNNVDKGGISHCDIVVGVELDHIIILGGNTAQSYPKKGKGENTAGQRRIKLDQSGFVIADQSNCKYFAIMKPPKVQAAEPSAPTGTSIPRLSPVATKPRGELVRFAQRVLNATERERLAEDGDLGRLTLAALERFRKKYYLGEGIVLDNKIQLALAQKALEEIAQQSIFPQLGVLDAKTEQALITFKSNRGLGFDASLNASTRKALADYLVKRKDPKQFSSPPSSLPTERGHSTSMTVNSVQVSDKVIAAVKQYQLLAASSARKYGVELALILGVIAAESGGDKNLVAKSGYTGLMQSDKGEAHKQPEISINAGTKKLYEFRKIMEGVLKGSKWTYEQLAEPEQLRLLALAYNAGPVTVAKALQYASESGSPEHWLDAEHYKRALLFTGAYSLKQAEASCLKNMNLSEQKSYMPEAVRIWNHWRLGTKKTNWRKLNDPPVWKIVSADLPPFVLCAIDFKHRNSPKYAAKILAYRDRFRLH